MFKDELIAKVRELQLVVSIFVFIFVTLLCWKVTGFDLTEIQLSAWGVTSGIWWLWNGSIILLSYVILFNVVHWIRLHPRIKYKRVLYILFTFMSVNLLMVGLFPIQFESLHNIPAFIYFFGYPLIIFFMVFINRKHFNYGEWFKHLLFSMVMITLPLMFIKTFDGMAIPEILHTSVVGLWNLSLLKKFKKI